MSDEEVIQNQRELFYDAWLDQQLEGAAEGGEGGGDLGGDMDLGGDDDLGGDLEGDLGGEEDLGGDEGESPLLAAPANRNIETTTVKSKGKKYVPKTAPNGRSQRGGDQRSAGGRRHHNKSQWSAETASSANRNTFKGAQEIMGLTGLNIAESKINTNYDKEEKKLFEVSADIKNLIKNLENKDDGQSEKE